MKISEVRPVTRRVRVSMTEDEFKRIRGLLEYMRLTEPGQPMTGLTGHEIAAAKKFSSLSLPWSDE